MPCTLFVKLHVSEVYAYEERSADFFRRFARTESAKRKVELEDGRR